MKSSPLLLLLFVFSICALAQPKRQPITNYTPREYGLNHSSYTLAVAEDEFGMIYVGTAYEILQFDGIRWESIPVKVGVYITSLSVLNNTIYIGSQGEFGYLKPDLQGKLQYHSISERLPTEEKNFTRIWKTLVWEETVVFQSEEKLFLYKNDSLTIVKPKTSFHLSFVDQNMLFVRERDSGILAFDGNQFNTVPNGNMFSNLGVFGILPFSDNNRLIVTRERGLWLWGEEKFTKPQNIKQIDQRISNSEVLGAIILNDGNYALYTLKDGVLIINRDFQIIAEYSDNSGMLSSEVWDLIEDKQGNLWTATQRGVCRIQYTSPFSFYDQTSGLFGIVNSVSNLNAATYVGTSVGLFVNHEKGMKSFEEVEALKGSGTVWAIEKIDKGLWVATDNGLWYTDGRFFQRINNLHVSTIVYVPQMNWVIASGRSGFHVFDSQSRTLLFNDPNISGEMYGVAYKHNGKSNQIEVWLGSRTGVVWQVVLNDKLSITYDFYYGSEDGLNPDWVCPYQVGNDVVFATSLGMLRFVSPVEMYKLLGDSTINLDDLRGYFDNVNFPKYSEKKSITAFHYNTFTSYAAMEYYVYEINMNDSIPSNFRYKTLQVGRFNTLRKNENHLFIGSDDGLVIVDQTKLIDSIYPKPNLLVRSIAIGYDSIIWHGDIALDNKQFVVPFSMNTVTINLASSYYDNGIGAQFSWKQKGVDQSYSRWTSQGQIILPNLHEGEYELSIVAKNIHDELGNEVVVRFIVLPPWYRTWWAYSIYVIIAMLIVLLVVNLYIRRLKAQNRRLEKIVKLRTREVVEQKEHIELILQDIRSSISYAQRIQQALLPSQEYLKECFPNHFILFYPRDVVSGDFYWAGKVNDWLIITVVDCTGHGVPGAFMSMLGMSFLHEIVRKHEVTNAAAILNLLRKAVIEALKQTGKRDEQKDGMDMSLAAINLNSNSCLWAGANNPLYIVRKTIDEFEELTEKDPCKYITHKYQEVTLLEVKSDKMPVAIHTVMQDYSNHEIDLQKGDRLFLFTDGYTDQFGGPDYRKFMSKSFRELIARTSSLPINQQGKVMEKSFISWKHNNGEEYEQIDDVTVLGIEV